MSNQRRRPLTEKESVQDNFWNQDVLREIHTRSPRMLQTFEKVKSVAPTKTTVLLLGDTGVGKGMVAKLIHQHSSRKDEEFVHEQIQMLDSFPERNFHGIFSKQVLGMVRSRNRGFCLVIIESHLNVDLLIPKIHSNNTISR